MNTTMTTTTSICRKYVRRALIMVIFYVSSNFLAQMVAHDYHVRLNVSVVEALYLINYELYKDAIHGQGKDTESP